MNTQDLSKLSYREIDQLADLLKAYANNPNDCGLGDGVKWEYNPYSDNLFLVDDDYNVAMMNWGKLEKFYSCPNCGNEGFIEDFTKLEKENEYCCPDCIDKGRNLEDHIFII